MKKYFTLFVVLVLSLNNTFSQRFQPGQTIPDSLFREQGEVYFRFLLQNPPDLQLLTRIISIDNVRGSEVRAYASQLELEKFLLMGYGCEILPHPGTLIPEAELLPPQPAPDFPLTNWNFYPNYQQYLDYMAGFVASYPEICRLDTVGLSMQGRLILVLRISKNVNQEEAEPHFLYTSSIHGDETTGYVLMMHLIEYLLQNYGSNPRITQMIDNIEICINPLANPDGTFYGGNNSVYGARRYNANNVDLNRNFPDPKVGPHPDGNPWQLETEHWMAYADTNRFSLSMNFHGGEEVFNYPWDTWSKLAADDAWWQYVAHEYVDTLHLVSPASYFSGFNNGITNGYAWYEINGGRQDYMNYFHYCREATLEVSQIKLLPASQLLNHWNYNYRSLLNYIEQAGYGFMGVVTDTVTGEPIRAKVYIFGHDIDNSFVYSSLPTGFYARHIEAGSYTVGFSSPGYFSKSIKNVNVANHQKTTLDVQLRPLTFGIEEAVVAESMVFPNPVHDAIQVVLPEEVNETFAYHIYNSMGGLVLSGNMNPSSGKVTLNSTGEMQHGVYILRITTGKRVYTDRFMVTN